MKKLFILPALLAAAAAFGQYTESNTKFGITGNVHQSNIRGIHWDSKGRYGIGLGVFAEIPFSENKTADVERPGGFYFTPQVEYSMDGEFNDASTGKQKYLTDFIAVPLMFKYYFAFNKTANKDFFLQAGPEFAFNVSSKASGPDDSYSTENAEHVNYVEHHKDNFKKFNFGAVVAAGYRFDKHWQIFLRYDHGFTKVYDNYSLYSTWHYKLGGGINYIFK